MDHIFFLRVGWAISKNNSCTAKTAGKKMCKGSHEKKIKQVLSSTIILILMLKKILAQSIAHQKKIMHNLKVREKKIIPQKIGQLQPQTPLKK